MKFIIENFEIEHIESSDPMSVSICMIGFNFARVVLKVDVPSMLKAKEAIKADKIPTSIKFGSIFRGYQFNFSKQQTLFYTGSLQTWLLPFSFTWKPCRSYKKSEVINMINYFTALHDKTLKPDDEHLI